MPRIRTLLTRVEIDTAQRAHNCQANARHRVERGDLRLKVRNGRSWDHYCLNCAKGIINRDIRTLEGIAKQIGKMPTENAEIVCVRS